MANDTVATRQHQLKVSRVFHARREQVFTAWSSGEHVKQWFCPAAFTVPQAHVEFRAGGRFDVCMRAPDGQEHWTRGHFVEIVPNARLVIEMSVPGADGELLFSAHTEVNFLEAPCGTNMEVTQTYTLLQPIAEQMVKGAQQGWSETLDRLGTMLVHSGQEPAVRSVVHGSFRLERRYDAPRERVWQAFTDIQAKSKWFGAGEGNTIVAREMDVRPGGREQLKASWGGTVSTFDAVYFDVVPNERLVYTYDMYLDERKISVSLATVEFKQDGAGTRVVMSEQGAFLDGYDDAGSRERGTNYLLDAVGASLKD